MPWRRRSSPGHLCSFALVLALVAGLTACSTPTPPNASPSLTAFNGTATGPAEVTFAWSAADPDGDTLTCALDADGDTVTDATIADCGTTTTLPYSYASPGGYLARLTVDDGQGHALTASATVIANGTSTTPPTWVRQIGTSDDDIAVGAVVLGDGSSYVAGSTKGNLAGVANGVSDALLLKLAPDGTPVWTRQFGTTGSDLAHAVAVDAGGNAYVVGETDGDLGGPNAGSNDAFVAKYDAAGTQKWLVQVGTASPDFAVGVAVGPSGTVVVTGFTGGALIGTSHGSVDAFVLTLTANGAPIWTRQFGTVYNDWTYGVAVNAAGDIAVSGYTEGALDGANAGARDAFLARYDAQGNQAWVRQLGSLQDDYGLGVGLADDGRAVLGGATAGVLDTSNAGFEDVFLASYDRYGTRQWLRQIGGSGDDVAYAAVLDAAGNVIAAGTSNGTIGTSPVGGYDAFAMKLDRDGNAVWTRVLGTTADDRGYAVAVNAQGTLVVAGTTDGDLGATNAGPGDLFAASYLP